MEQIIEKAKEELKMLETLHPHRFTYIKLELQSFIASLLHSQQSLGSLPSASTTTTRASTSMKKNKKKKRKRDRVDVVLDKAQACLRKIHNFKNSSSFSN